MKNIKAILLALFIAAFGLAFGQKGGYSIGSTVENFSLKSVDDKEISLNDYTDKKGVIVIFTCNHCPYAKKYEQRIMMLDNMYKEKGFPVVAINPNDPEVQPEDSFEAMKEIAKEKGYTFPYLLDEGQKVYPKFGATKTPHVFVLQNEKGKFVVKYIGTIDNNYENPDEVSERYVEDAVNAIIDGKPIKNEKTVAIGCTIKVKK